jgi:hypothetical protein
MPQQPERINLIHAASRAAYLVSTDCDGTTLDLRTGDDVGLLKKWAVGIQGREFRLNQRPTSLVFLSFLELNSDQFANHHSMTRFLGVWFSVHEKCWFLDVVVLFDELGEAMLFASENSQRFIYYLANGEIRAVPQRKVA